MTWGRVGVWLTRRQKVIALGLSVGGAIAIGLVLLGLLPYGRPGPFGPMGDASAYWLGARAANPYDWQVGSAEYRYSPAFLWLIAPISWLPWEVFAAVWVGLHLAIIAWFRAPWLLAFPPVADDIIRGNIGLFVAAMIVLALRYPGVWAFGLLTKITPWGIGVLWHLVRREWFAAGLALGVTSAIVALGFIIQPELWQAWLATLGARGINDFNAVYFSLPLRLPVAAVIVVAARHRPLWLPVAVAVAMPTLYLSSLAVLAAWVPLYRRRRQAEGHTGTSAVVNSSRSIKK